MKSLRIIFVGALICGVVVLMSCSSPKRYDQAITTWNGVPLQFLLKQWGKPTSVQTVANGHRYYLYTAVTRRSLEVLPGNTARPGFPGSTQVFLNQPLHPKQYRYTILNWCDTGFEVNEKGIIVNTVIRGNDCVVTKDDEIYLLSGE